MIASLVVIDNLDIMGVAFAPSKADTPLVVDPDGLTREEPLRVAIGEAPNHGVSITLRVITITCGGSPTGA